MTARASGVFQKKDPSVFRLLKSAEQCKEGLRSNQTTPFSRPLGGTVNVSLVWRFIARRGCVVVIALATNRAIGRELIAHAVFSCRSNGVTFSVVESGTTTGQLPYCRMILLRKVYF